jgi:hypothetical protein
MDGAGNTEQYGVSGWDNPEILETLQKPQYVVALNFTDLELTNFRTEGSLDFVEEILSRVSFLRRIILHPSPLFLIPPGRRCNRKTHASQSATGESRLEA